MSTGFAGRAVRAWRRLEAFHEEWFAARWRHALQREDRRQADTFRAMLLLHSLGVDVRLYAFLVIGGATLCTASAVCISGTIGWVGLVMPHIARKFVGDDCRILIPASALIGGIFLLLVDDLARNLYTIELPLGILTSLIGAPFFLYLMIRRRE